MIEISRGRLGKAIEKARRVKNHVRVLAWRKYEVRTPEQHIYTVTFSVRGGSKLADCTCAAGAKNQACYHIASAIALHCHIAKSKAADEPICKSTPPLRARRMQVDLDGDGPLLREPVNNPTPGLLIMQQPGSNGRYCGIEI